MNSFLGLIDKLGTMEEYLLVFIGGAIGSLFTYLALSKRLASPSPTDKEITPDNSSLERPIIFINSNKIIKRSIIFNDSALRSSLDTNQAKYEINQILVEFLKNYTRNKRSVVINRDGSITGAIDLTHAIGDNFILYLDKISRPK